MPSRIRVIMEIIGTLNRTEVLGMESSLHIGIQPCSSEVGTDVSLSCGSLGLPSAAEWISKCGLAKQFLPPPAGHREHGTQVESWWLVLLPHQGEKQSATQWPREECGDNSTRFKTTDTRQLTVPWRARFCKYVMDKSDMLRLWCTCIPASTPVLLDQQVQAGICTTSNRLGFKSKLVFLEISKWHGGITKEHVWGGIRNSSVHKPRVLLFPESGSTM